MRKKHYTRDEIIKICNQVARERRMAHLTPWTAMSIICGYTLLKEKDFKGKRIHAVSKAVDAYETKYLNGEIDLQEMRRAVIEKCDFLVLEYNAYTEQDIAFRKGTFNHWIDEKQLQPQNAINEFAIRYMIFFFTVLGEMHGYGEKRIKDIYTELNKNLNMYADNKISLKQWQKELMEDAGIWFDVPEDPITKTKGNK
ncbi:MAG: hypothetical protein KBT34_10020 [Prevotella sp.]|nr:hypothetical protein [Candidatus Prevotella equi]